MARRIVLGDSRSEEHTSELQAHSDIVCRLLLEKKKKNTKPNSVATTTMNHPGLTVQTSTLLELNP